MGTFCRDCTFCRRFWAATNAAEGLELARCAATRTINLVTGNEVLSPCSSARAAYGECGPEAKLFQPKDLPLREQLVRSLEATPLIATVQ